MKNFILVIAVCLAFITPPLYSHAEFRIGPRAGVDISHLHFNKDIFSSENRLGFTGGLQAEVNLPLGFSFDLSAMYVRRSTAGSLNIDGDIVTTDSHRDYVNVPVNVRWKLSIGAVGKFISPYIFTGPDFAFLLSDNVAVGEDFESRKTDISWNVGFGLELFRHLQLSATYGMGLTDLKNINANIGSWINDLKAKNNNWTLTAAWMF